MSFKGLALIMLVLLVCPMTGVAPEVVGAFLGRVLYYWMAVSIVIFKAIIQGFGI